MSSQNFFPSSFLHPPTKSRTASRVILSERIAMSANPSTSTSSSKPLGNSVCIGWSSTRGLNADPLSPTIVSIFIQENYDRIVNRVREDRRQQESRLPKADRRRHSQSENRDHRNRRMHQRK